MRAPIIVGDLPAHQLSRRVVLVGLSRPGKGIGRVGLQQAGQDSVRVLKFLNAAVVKDGEGVGAASQIVVPGVDKGPGRGPCNVKARFGDQHAAGKSTGFKAQRLDA